MSFRRLIATAVALVPIALPAAVRADDKPGNPPGDAFIAGYAAAVLEREMSVKPDGLSVNDGHVTLKRTSLSPAERAQVVKTLSSIPGVKDVTLYDGGTAVSVTPAQEPFQRTRVVAPTTGAPTPGASTSGPGDTGEDAGTKIETDDTPLTLFFGVGRTFSPILADPRWPHFYASYLHYDTDRFPTKLSDVASVGFGETISIIKQAYPSGFRWEAGVQGGLFAIFDMDSNSKDLINADYFVGPYVAMRQGDFSAFLRVNHQSSHLGDEYVLRAQHEVRQNYSFETANFLLSYDLPAGFRIYGGAGVLFDVDPSNTKRLTAQYGAEWVSPTTIFGTNWIRPIAAVDFQNHENNDWALSYSIHAGVQLEDPARFTQRLQLMLEYYDGNSPDGQFYDDHIRFLGVGVHFYF